MSVRTIKSLSRKYQIFVLLICILTSYASSECSLKAVSILFRHGARSPIGSYPKDPYLGYKWPGGRGALTAEGIQQLFSSGVKFRERFKCLISENSIYNSGNIHVRSSKVERCVISAESFMAGFFPPLNESAYTHELPWQPVQIHTVPIEQDHLLAQIRKPCRKYDETYADGILNPNFLKINGKLPDYFEFIKNNTGFDHDFNLLELFLLKNNLQVQKENSLKIPDWAEKIYEPILIPYSKIFFNLYSKTNFTLVRGGALMSSILDRLRNAKNGGPNVLIDSAHDMTVFSIISVLEAIEPLRVEQVEYAGTISFELYENMEIKNDLEIKIFYFRNYAQKNPIEFKMPNCTEPCAFEKFAEILEPNLVHDFDRTCNRYY